MIYMGPGSEKQPTCNLRQVRVYSYLDKKDGYERAHKI